jgi:hypothetical protein
MIDPALNRMLAALDSLVAGETQELACDIDEASLRLRRAARFGVLAENSPYVAFIGRLLDDKRHAVYAASA